MLVEVMGRDCGYLALMSAITGGAEAVAIPEVDTDPECIASEIRDAYRRGKPHAIVVVAEGAKYNAEKLAHYFTEHQERLGFDLRVTILGHVQRGGNPTFADRMLATRLGYAAVQCVENRETGVLVGINKGEITTTPLEKVVVSKKPIDIHMMKLANVLAK